MLPNKPCEKWAITTDARPSNCEDSLRRISLNGVSAVFAFLSQPRKFFDSRNNALQSTGAEARLYCHGVARRAVMAVSHKASASTAENVKSKPYADSTAV